MKQKGLGRGLDALLGEEGGGAGRETLTTLGTGEIRPGRYQPRTRMDEVALAELAESIRKQGLLQPLLVRPVERGYELIAGERRWRAAQKAGLERVPVIVREVPNDAALAMALIENIQREDLNAMEEAAGVQRLIDEFGMTHEQAADAVGRSRSATSNLLRLLKLAKQLQEMVLRGALEMGHARALLALDGARQIEAANRVVARGLSVRDTEKLVQSLLRGAPARRRKKSDRDLARLEEQISERLGTSVEIQAGAKGRGKIVVHYSSLDHLDQLLKRLK
jgi:ParB family transcriptional regulator, chromosome partitioning protein